MNPMNQNSSTEAFGRFPTRNNQWITEARKHGENRISSDGFPSRPRASAVHWLFHSRRPIGGGKAGESGENHRRSPILLTRGSRP
jgi:hypothetical protein